MSRWLSAVAMGAVLVGFSSSAQAQSDRAYPMNVEDRINGISSSDTATVYQTDRRPTPSASATTANATNSAVTTKTGGLEGRADGWRYRWHRNRWWYYGADQHWQYWNGGRWNAYPTAAAEAGK